MPLTPATSFDPADRRASVNPIVDADPSGADPLPLTVARLAFELLVTGPRPLALDGRHHAGLPNRTVPLDKLRGLLLARSCPRATRDAVWRELVTRSRESGGAWTVGCVGVALPALAALAGELGSGPVGDRADLQAELLHGFLAGLAQVDLSRPAVLARLRWAAYRAGYAAVRERLNAPTPYPQGFASAPPPAPSAHPDFVLADAVRAGVITRWEADLIGATRLETVSLRDWATEHAVSYESARKTRQRAERRLVAFVTELIRGEGSDPGQAAGGHGRGRLRAVEPAGTAPGSAPGEECGSGLSQIAA